jgi:chemotaxis protein methyltransferase CheR
LHGLILVEKAQPEAALAALRRCVFADASFVLGHVALADVLSRQGQKERARKSLENAGRLVAGRRPDELIPEGDGLTVGRLLEIVTFSKRGQEL